MNYFNYEESEMEMYNNSYFDPEEFLSEEQLVPCYFKVGAKNAGNIIGLQAKDITPNSLHDIPYWMTEVIDFEEYIRRDLPNAFQPNVQAGIQACPSNIDLNSVASHFYNFGKKLAHNSNDLQLTETLTQFLSKVFIDRLAMLYDQAYMKYTKEADDNAFLQTLDGLEKEIYRTLIENRKCWTEWEN